MRSSQQKNKPNQASLSHWNNTLLRRLFMNRKSLSVLSTPKSHSSIPLRSMSPSIFPSPSINNTNISPITTTHRSSSTIPSSSSHSFTDSSNYSTQPLSSSTIPISNDYTQSYSSIQENNIYSDTYIYLKRHNILSPIILQDKELFKKKNSINRIPQNNRFHSNSISTVYDNNILLTDITESSKTKHSSLRLLSHSSSSSIHNLPSTISYSLSIYIHNQSETTHYNTPIALLLSSKYIYNIDLYSSNPSIDIHYSNNNNNEDNNNNIQSNDILDPTEHFFNIYMP
ncbi:hypothetical protein WA158_004232 [Blastocystis sp. Blastoise]